MKRISKRIITLFICLLVCVVAFLPMQILASEGNEQNKKCNLSVLFSIENQIVSDVEFRMYKVADIKSSGQFVTTQIFSSYPVKINYEDTDSWSSLATTLSGYVTADKIAPQYKAKTDKISKANFNDISPGFYLVSGSFFETDSKIYTPQSFMMCLPGKGINNSAEYDVSVKIKYDSRPIGQSVNLEVLKIWKDSDKSKRDSQVIIELYNGMELYDIVVLDKNNNWRFYWNDLSEDGEWIVRERSVADGYTVSVERQGDTFVVTNTNSSSSENGSTKPSDTLPQTGLLWWPVPVLIAVGIFMFILGYLKNRGASYEK